VDANLLLLAAVGLVAGFVGSLLGIGGGFFVIPMLTLALGLPMQTAVGTSLVAVVATSSISSTSFLKSGLTNLKLAMTLEVVTTVGAVAGAFIAVALSQTALGILFAAVMVYVAYTMGRRPGEADRSPHIDADGNTWGARFFDPSLGRLVSYKVRRMPLGMGLSGLAGLLSGLLGIGGGVVKVPVMSLVMSIPVKAAIATSSYMIGLTAVASAFIYLYRGYILPAVAGSVALGVVAGALIGARVASRAGSLTLRRAFAVITFLVAVTMVLRAVFPGLFAGLS
jgi:uncharacterized membrane protein YfcA